MILSHGLFEAELRFIQILRNIFRGRWDDDFVTILTLE